MLPFFARMSLASKIILPVLIIGAASMITWGAIKLKPEAETRVPEPVLPRVQVIPVQPETIHLQVQSQGTVQARTVTTLKSEVSGRIEYVAPQFRPGAFFEEGTVLLKIDPSDYEAALAQQEANLAQAILNLAQEEALAEQAALDWADLGEGTPPALAVREPQLKQARAAIRSAEAAVAKARRDLERTEVRAPYPGRVLEQHVDRGQSVSGQPGDVLARIYAVDTAEVRLPVSSHDMLLLDLPFLYLGEEERPGPAVTLTVSIGGKDYSWQGRIIRSEGTMDDRSRFNFLVAEVPRPFERDPANQDRPPFKPGLFVKAEIEGREIPGVFKIPRTALRENNTVLVVDPDDHLYRRKVNVIQADTTHAIITNGFGPGDTVVTSPLELAVDGMAVVRDTLSPRPTPTSENL